MNIDFLEYQATIGSSADSRLIANKAQGIRARSQDARFVIIDDALQAVWVLEFVLLKGL